MARQLKLQGKLDMLHCIYLYQNDLRDGGLAALAPVLTKERFPAIKQAPQDHRSVPTC